MYHISCLDNDPDIYTFGYDSGITTAATISMDLIPVAFFTRFSANGSTKYNRDITGLGTPLKPCDLPEFFYLNS